MYIVKYSPLARGDFQLLRKYDQRNVSHAVKVNLINEPQNKLFIRGSEVQL
jgi:hypothetical protein